MRRLVESWVTAERANGNNCAAAIRCLNAALGMKITHSRVSEWRRGVYAPSPEVVSLLLNWTLPWALRKAGIAATVDQVRALEALLWRTVEIDGKRQIELL